jgi:hypothetical protein
MIDTSESTAPVSEELFTWRDLPFVRGGEDGRLESAWSPWGPASDPGTDGLYERHLIGMSYALRLVSHERTAEFQLVDGELDVGYLMMVAGEIVRQGRWGAVEQGFFNAIFELLLNGSVMLGDGFEARPDKPLGRTDSLPRATVTAPARPS